MTDFERKLAAMQPRQLREIELPEAPTVTNRDLRSGAKQFIIALAGFLIGVVVTYIAMKPPVEPPPQTVVTLPIDDAMLGSLRRPMDLRHLSSVRVVPPNKINGQIEKPNETEFQYRTLLLKEIESQRR